MSENFLSRWSKRKLEVREQEKLAESASAEFDAKAILPGQSGVVAKTTQVDDVDAAKATPQPELPLPTESDLQAVEQGGDIRAFMVDKVSRELKNKAFKALFSRPEFNVMDGLDIYIDDYNKFTPLSQEDIAKMTFSKQLLSRPDLETPKISDTLKGGDTLLEEILEPDESNNPEKANDSEPEKVVAAGEEEAVFDDNPEEYRVIPDGSQVIDPEGLIKNHSFEKVTKQTR